MEIDMSCVSALDMQKVMYGMSILSSPSQMLRVNLEYRVSSIHMRGYPSSS